MPCCSGLPGSLGENYFDTLHAGVVLFFATYRYATARGVAIFERGRQIDRSRQARALVLVSLLVEMISSIIHREKITRVRQ